MKLLSQFFLFCFFVVLSLEFLDSILAAKFRRNGNDSGTLGGNVRENRSSDAMLLSDGNEHGTEDGEDVVLSGTGPINLTLTHEMLEFEICDNCAGTSRVCYESRNGWEDSDAVGSCSVPNSCEFKVKDDGNGIYFGTVKVFKRRFIPSIDGSCLSTIMKFPSAEVLPNQEYTSCEPKMDDNKMVKLFVFIDQRCSIKVKGAKIHVPPTPLPLTVPPPTKSPAEDSAEASSFPDWGYIIIGIVILIAIAAIIGVIVFYLYKKRQTSKRASQKPVETKPKPTVSKADVAADVKTPTKKNDDLEAAKVEPTQIPNKDKKKITETLEAAKVKPIQMPKKEKKPKTPEPTTAEDVPENKKKTKTLEPKTAEDAPAPSVSKQEPPTPTSKEPVPTEHQPTPRPRAACYPQVKRLIPRGMKSAKSDSLDETLKMDKRAMVESFIVSAENLCLTTDASDVWDEIKANYPNIQHEVLATEIKLLCLPVSQMYEELNTLVQYSVNKLCAAGFRFDMDRQIVTVLKGARQFLKDPATDATTVYFAFGAEYPYLITDDPEIMDKASIPLLYVIALQPRFPEASRRKACAIMRRKLVRVLGYYKAADRAKMPFPVNIVENAYCRDPKYFYDPSAIKTNSGSDGKKKQIADGKRKKKSSKKH